MAHVLAYPLTPIPLCFSHIDGKMNKTPKASLFNCLKKKLDIPCNPFSIDVLIIDGFFLLHLFFDLPTTFLKIASHVLSKICQTRARRVDLIFDNFVKPSIKDIERDHCSHCDRDVPFVIKGPNQKRVSVRVTIETDSYIFTACGGRILKVLDDNLSSMHEDADTPSRTGYLLDILMGYGYAKNLQCDFILKF